MIINLNFGNVSNFINVTSQFDCEFNLIQRQTMVDGKSLVGVLSLDFSQPIDVNVISNDTNVIDKFKRLLELNSISVKED